LIKKVLVIDNYDSFTYNLVQYLGELGAELSVVRNDMTSIEEIEKKMPEAIVISPGPKRPEQAGLSIEIIKKFGPHIPVIGVCLGHQAIGVAFGGKIKKLKPPCHGKTSLIYHDGKDIFEAIENPFVATRYHSLVIERESFPAELEIAAHTLDDVIMAVRHREHPIFGVQFHPESILTAVGKTILKNFLSLEKKK
jgi:anthranilate synthase/aminodeoxychorismate synthase-like glutamine amidotransferase